MKYAIIPSTGRDCLKRCIEAIEDQVDNVIVIDTLQFLREAPNGHWFWRTDVNKVHLIDSERTETNISHWWNCGLRAIVEYLLPDKIKNWDVAIINDDAIVPSGWVDAVSANMRKHAAVAGCSGQYDVVLRKAEAVQLDMRMQGFAFLLAGEAGLRANEDLHWYFSDDYVDWESRRLGGMAMQPGFPVAHLHPNGQMTPELQVQTGKDAQAFLDLYGRMPW